MIKKLLSLSLALFLTSAVFSQTQNVTFQVANPDSTPVYVFGSWSGWSNWPGDQMTDSNGDGIFEKTLNIASNTAHEYLFVNGVGPTKETLNPAWLCTNGNGQYTNRVLPLANLDTTICVNWSSCSACGTIVIPYVDVKFQVQNPPATPVRVFGSWSGWSNWPGTLMTFNASDNAYEATISVQSDSAVEYLFISGPDTTKEALNPAMTCTNGNGEFTNRKSLIGLNDTTICAKWQSCDACEPLLTSEQIKSTVTVSLHLNGININSTENIKFNQVELFDVLGRSIYNNLNGFNSGNKIDVPLQYNSIYFIKLKANENSFTFKGIVTN
jgi:hypothetical protein